MVITKSVDNKEYTWDQFLNALGGSLSLFLGMSLIAAFEIIELFINFFVDILVSLRSGSAKK